MPFDVKLPDIGEGVAEGEIVRWFVKAGDRVREDQPLVEVMTDKATVEIPSPRTGVVAALHAAEGQVVKVGAAIISIDVEGGAAPAPGATGAAAAGAAAHAASTTGAGAATSVAAAAPPATRVQATPAVRQLAKQLGVALDGIAGSGPAGAITADDVKRAAGGASAPSAGPPAAATATPTGDTRVPLRGLRRKIAEHMRHSIETAAHFTFVAECDMTELVAHREATRARAEQQGVKLTYLAYVVKALVPSLAAFPTLNASLDDAAGEIVLHARHDIGVATQTPDGLTVPVIHSADGKGLFDLAREIDRLARAAREQSLAREDLTGGTFTVTSTGAQGGLLATPILHHPQVAILGVHAVGPKPAVRDGAIVIRQLGNLSLSLDHRVVDGATGAAFLYDLIHRLETPGEWIGAADLT